MNQIKKRFKKMINQKKEKEDIINEFEKKSNKLKNSSKVYKDKE